MNFSNILSKTHPFQPLSRIRKTLNHFSWNILSETEQSWWICSWSIQSNTSMKIVRSQMNIKYRFMKIQPFSVWKLLKTKSFQLFNMRAFLFHLLTLIWFKPNFIFHSGDFSCHLWWNKTISISAQHIITTRCFGSCNNEKKKLFA